MKHMIVNSHSPESCAFRSDDDGRILGEAVESFRTHAVDQGVTVDEFWINRAAHTFFILADAPNAHSIDEALLKAGLVGRTHTEVFPVMTYEQVSEAREASS